MNVSKIPATGQWIKATFGGWLLGVVLILLLSSCLEGMGIGHLQFYTGLGMGAGVGFGQWWLLRKYRLATGASWLLASLAGMGIPFIILDLVPMGNGPAKLPLGVAFGGMLVGLLQYRLLRQQAGHARVWIPASWLGWVAAALSVLLINYTMTIKAGGALNLLLALLNLLLILSGGVVLGIITGYTFKRLRWHHIS